MDDDRRDDVWRQLPERLANLAIRVHLLPWTPAGYGAPLPRPAHGEAEVLTPRPTVEALRAGYHPFLHPSAGA